MQELLIYTERMTRKLLSELPDGKFTFTDYLDNNGITNEKIIIKVTITIQDDTATGRFHRISTSAGWKRKRSLCDHVISGKLCLSLADRPGCTE